MNATRPTTRADVLQLTAPGDREIVMTRSFDAPRDLVFEAWTTPTLVRRWLLGPPGWSMPVCEIELRVGGSYRFVWRRDSDGRQMAMGGTYRDLAAAERIVATERFDEPWYAGEALVTTIFRDQGGRTTVTTTLLYQSREVRDAVLKTPMEGGVAQSYDRLAALLQSLNETAPATGAA